MVLRSSMHSRLHPIDETWYGENETESILGPNSREITQTREMSVRVVWCITPFVRTRTETFDISSAWTVWHHLPVFTSAVRHVTNFSLTPHLAWPSTKIICRRRFEAFKYLHAVLLMLFTILPTRRCFRIFVLFSFLQKIVFRQLNAMHVFEISLAMVWRMTHACLRWRSSVSSCVSLIRIYLYARCSYLVMASLQYNFTFGSLFIMHRTKCSEVCMRVDLVLLIDGAASMCEWFIGTRPLFP